MPIPDYLIPLLDRRGGFFSESRPHLDVLLLMAIADNRPDEVLRWYDRIASQPKVFRFLGGALAYADRVAAAVADAYPERAISIYRDALNAKLPVANSRPTKRPRDISGSSGPSTRVSTVRGNGRP